MKCHAVIGGILAANDGRRRGWTKFYRRIGRGENAQEEQSSEGLVIALDLSEPAGNTVPFMIV